MSKQYQLGHLLLLPQTGNVPVYVAESAAKWIRQQYPVPFGIDTD